MVYFMNYKIISLIALLLLFFGCVNENVEFSSSTEEIYKIYNEDFDNNGLIDRNVYEYYPVSYGESTSIKRYVLERNIYDLAEIDAYVQSNVSYGDVTYYLPSDAIYKLEQQLQMFKESSTEQEKGILKQVGLYDDINGIYYLCDSRTSCLQRCHTPKCDLGISSFGELFISDVLDLSLSVKEMDEKVIELDNSLTGYNDRNLTENEMNLLMEKILVIDEYASRVNSNTLISNLGGGLKIGPPIDYNLMYLQAMIDTITSEAVETGSSSKGVTYVFHDPPIKSVEYSVILEILHKSDNPYVKLKVTETMPWDVNNVVTDSNYTTINGDELYWELSQVGNEEIPGYLIYKFESPSRINSNNLGNINSPELSIESVNVDNYSWLQTVFSVIEYLNTKFGMFGTVFGVALIAALLGILLRYILWFLEFIWEFVLGLLSKKDLKKVFYDWIGEVNSNYIQYVAAGIILLVIGLGMTYNSPLTSINSLDDIRLLLTSNLIVTIGAFCIFLGVLSLYFSIEEYVKLKVMGAPQKKSDMKSRSKKSLEHLNGQVSKIHELLNNANNLRIDVSEEQELLLSIPVTRVTELVNEVNDQSQARILVEQSISRASYCIKLLEQKISTINNKWPMWDSYIIKNLEKQKRANVDDLVEIPRDWREIAIERFMLLHPEKNLVIDKGVLKPMVVRNKRVSTSTIPFDVAKYKINGQEENYPFDNGNSGFVGVLLQRLTRNLNLLDTPISRVKIKAVFVKPLSGKGHNTVVLLMGNKILFGKFSGHSIDELLGKVFKK